mgnify:CR=1 FL=1
MEEYVTRREFLEFKKQVEQRQTEEMKVTRVEVASADVVTQLKALEEEQKQSSTVLETVQENANTVKIQMEGARADIRVVKANQSDLRGYIEEQFKIVEEKQDRHTEILGNLITSAESHDSMLKTMNGKLDQIIDRLPPKQP